MFKKKLGFYVLVIVILVLVAAVPVLANGKDAVGTQLNLFDGSEQTISGPFHVLHGYNFPREEQYTGQGRTEFSLEIDGVAQDGRFLSYKEDGLQYHVRLFNFPDGLLPGEYVFKGTWDEPCNFYDLCDKKNALVDPPYTLEVNVTVE